MLRFCFHSDFKSTVAWFIILQQCCCALNSVFWKEQLNGLQALIGRLISNSFCWWISESQFEETLASVHLWHWWSDLRQFGSVDALICGNLFHFLSNVQLFCVDMALWWSVRMRTEAPICVWRIWEALKKPQIRRNSTQKKDRTWYQWQMGQILYVFSYAFNHQHRTLKSGWQRGGSLITACWMNELMKLNMTTLKHRIIQLEGT